VSLYYKVNQGGFRIYSLGLIIKCIVPCEVYSKVIVLRTFAFVEKCYKYFFFKSPPQYCYVFIPIVTFFILHPLFFVECIWVFILLSLLLFLHSFFSYFVFSLCFSLSLFYPERAFICFPSYLVLFFKSSFWFWFYFLFLSYSCPIIDSRFLFCKICLFLALSCYF